MAASMLNNHFEDVLPKGEDTGSTLYYEKDGGELEEKSPQVEGGEEQKAAIKTNPSTTSNTENSPSKRPAVSDSQEYSNKKPRTNYRDPNRLANIKAAIDCLLQQGSPDGDIKVRNLKEVSREFNIPYNTLRDNFLRYSFV